MIKPIDKNDKNKVIFCFFSILTGFFLFSEVSLAAWTPPIGIPAPAFGLNETAPAIPNPWITTVPGFYYICPACSGHTDSSNSYGYPAKPRNTIPSTLPAGSVVIISGAYNENHSSNSISANGTVGSPVFIRGENSAARPTATQKWIVNGSYYIIEYINFSWTNSSGNGKLEFGGDHGVVRNIDARGDTNDGVGGVYPDGSYMVIANSYLHDMGNINASYDQDNHCISVGSNTDHLWIVDNEVTRCSGDGMQINAGSAGAQASTHHIYFGRNDSHHNKQTGVWVKQATDVIISENKLHGHRESNSSQGDGTGGQYGPSNVWVIFNDIYDNESGVRFASASGMGSDGNRYIIGNKIYNIHKASSAYDTTNSWESAGISSWSAGAGTYLIGNTIWDVDAGFNTPSGGKYYIYNNIFDVNSISGANQIWIYESATAGASEMDYNLFIGNGRIRWGSSNSTISLASFKTTYPSKGQHALSVNDAKLTNTAAGNFHLISGSPAIDAGTANSVYNTFNTLYGIDIKKDLDGIIRPQGSAWDIGAYEYISGGDTTPPAVPTGLVVQ